MPTPPAFATALLPGWGLVQTWVLESAVQFRPDEGPDLTSLRYARDLNEVKEIGALNSATRTAEQTNIAKFWLASAALVWNPVLRQVVLGLGLDESDAARDFALMNVAGADARIACWDAKYAFTFWRPVTAIQRADEDGNPATQANPGWTPSSPRRTFPSTYPGTRPSAVPSPRFSGCFSATTLACRSWRRARPTQASSAIGQHSAKAFAKSSTPVSIPGFTFARPTSAAPNLDGRLEICHVAWFRDTHRNHREGPSPTRALRPCQPVSLAQMPQQPHLRDLPVTFDRLARNVQDLGGLLDAQPTEEAELDDAALALIHISQRLDAR